MERSAGGILSWNPVTESFNCNLKAYFIKHRRIRSYQIKWTLTALNHFNGSSSHQKKNAVKLVYFFFFRNVPLLWNHFKVSTNIPLMLGEFGYKYI